MPGSILSGSKAVSLPNGAQILYEREEAISDNVHVVLCFLPQLEDLIASKNDRKKIETLLSEKEKEIFHGFRFSKRKKEWLGGRLAAKHCLFSMYQRPKLKWSSISILSHKNGSPMLLSNPGLKLDIFPFSISHSGDFAAASACKGESCGIDIQKIDSGTIRVKDRFAQQEEVEILQQCDHSLTEEEFLTLLWSAKEAVKKCLLREQNIYFAATKLRAVTTNGGSCYKLQCSCLTQDINVTVHHTGNYMLAFTQKKQ